MVEGPNGVNRENRCSGARLGGCTEQSANSLSADTGAQAVLVGHTGCLKVRREVLRQDPPDKPPQHVADYKRPHAAIRLAQGDKASDPETLKYDGRDGGVGKPTGGGRQCSVASARGA